MKVQLKIIKTNFTSDNNWLFLLSNDKTEDRYYIMDSSFYKEHNLKSPITNRELDFYDVGQQIIANVDQIADQNIVVKILSD